MREHGKEWKVNKRRKAKRRKTNRRCEEEKKEQMGEIKEKERTGKKNEGK